MTPEFTAVQPRLGEAQRDQSPMTNSPAFGEEAWSSKQAMIKLIDNQMIVRQKPEVLKRITKHDPFGGFDGGGGFKNLSR